MFANAHSELDHLVRSNTPLASWASSYIMVSSSSIDSATATPVSEADSSTANLDSHNLLLPIPSLLTTKPHTHLTLSDIIDDSGLSDPHSAELASAEISIAPDASFIELSSGPAARELKRRWDLQIGVGKSVRSPYAITAFVNQHGKQMFRVGRRELSAPAANAAEIEERITQSVSPPEPSSSSPRRTRRSRMSMHAFPSMFKNGVGSRPHTSAAHISGHRKLRKTRSNSDMTSLDTSSQQNVPGTSATGRVHSRSVTSADVAPFSTVMPPDPPTHDLFSEVMDWAAPPPASPSSHSIHSIASSPLSSGEPYDYFKSHARIAYPFGHGVTFNSPSRKTPHGISLSLHLPHFLREMQSFESGLTARQMDPPNLLGNESPTPASPYLDRPPSALRIYPSSPSTIELTPTSPIPTFSPSLEAALFSHYSTDVFDVLQTYRGLPLLDKLSLESEEKTIKMSLSTDESATPRDDPRFVIWGEVQPDRDYDGQSVSHESLTDLSIHSSMSKRRTSRAKASEAPSVQSSPGGDTQKVLLAATIERWIAQLTSDLNYDELLDFFLTYRTYVSAIDLCHLLICRFHWALQQPSSLHDEKVRRIVRVRTFVAVRYWLLTFFTVDFLPNRELRLLVANWLNTLVRDPILKKHSDGLGIVRKLIKVAKDCRLIHTPSTAKSRPRASSEQPKLVTPKPHVLGEKFAAATQKSEADDDDSDLDLDFLPDEDAPRDIILPFQTDSANSHLATAHVVGATSLSSARPASIPFSSFSILQRTDHALGGPVAEPDTLFVQTTPPIHHNAISRVFVKTIGRLGRWKRVLNSRASARTSLGACANVSAFDLELNMSRDLLTVSGGVEQYLKMVGPPSPVVSAQGVPVTEVLEEKMALPPLSATKLPSVVELSPIVHAGEGAEQVTDQDALSEDPPAHDQQEPSVQSPEVKTVGLVVDTVGESMTLPDLEDGAGSLRSSSTESLGQPLAAGGPAPMFPNIAKSQWQFEIVSIDELDLSDTSSDHGVDPNGPPGLRRPPRKLPLRRDFEFVKESNLVSSMGISARGSVQSNTSSVASSVGGGGLGGNVAQWQLNALVDSLSVDEEKGDVEDALKRLEGQINRQKQQEKASKVDGWVRSIRERMAAGDYDDGQSLSDCEDEDDSDEEEDDSDKEESVDGSNRDLDQSLLSDGVDDPDQGLLSDGFDDEAVAPVPAVSERTEADSALDGLIEDGEGEASGTPVPTQKAHRLSSLSFELGSSPPRSSEARPALEDAVPLEILQSRMPSRPTTADAPLRQSLSRFASNSEPPPVHRSFILNYRAATLAEHFAMIDRELVMGIKFEELVLDDWMACKEVNVHDWVQFLKDRARWKAESRFPEKTNALSAVRGRFNLMANFTISEIVLTAPNARPVLVAKFIRVAWKAYLMSSFNTLVAILTGLGSDWVMKAMRRPGWNRVGIWENRMLKDLKLFASHLEDFKYIRQVVTSIVDVKPLEVASHSPSVVSGGAETQSGKGKVMSDRSVTPSACIPFIGIYLSQLQRHSRLPDLIDPTAPDEVVGINPDTSNFDAPAHPEVFSALAPLPESMNLEPLINVHKQRRVAGVIKSLVAGQHLASRVHFDVDKKLFQKCLRLRGLNYNTLQRALAMYPE